MALYLVEVTETYTTRYFVSAATERAAEKIAEKHNLDDAGDDGDLIGSDRQSVAVGQVASTTWTPVLTEKEPES